MKSCLARSVGENSGTYKHAISRRAMSATGSTPGIRKRASILNVCFRIEARHSGMEEFDMSG
jgi:hypothetical protein